MALTLRNVGGYILAGVATLPNFSLLGLDGLLAAINKEQGTTFTKAQLNFGDPGDNSDTYYDSTVLLTATNASIYQGTFTFKYHRFPLGAAFDGKALDKPAQVGSTIYATLAAINSKFNLQLAERDIVDAPIASGASSFTLTVKSTSYFYKPGTSITLGTA